MGKGEGACQVGRGRRIRPSLRDTPTHPKPKRSRPVGTALASDGWGCPAVLIAPADKPHSARLRPRVAGTASVKEAEAGTGAAVTPLRRAILCRASMKRRERRAPPGLRLLD